MQGQVAFALFRGPGLVLIAANETFFARTDNPGALGQPVSEAFPQDHWSPLQDALRRVYQTGIAEEITIGRGGRGGTVTVDRVQPADQALPCVVPGFRATVPSRSPRGARPRPRVLLPGGVTGSAAAIIDAASPR